MKNRFAHGYTLIELMVSIGIVGLLLAVTVPNYKDFILNNRRTTQTNEFVLAMTYAKSEAVRRGSRVTVCSRGTDTSCAGSANWDAGWLVFTDDDSDGTVDTADLVLQVRSTLEGANTLRAAGSGTAARQSVTFEASGFVRVGNNGTFNLCDPRGSAYGEMITVSLQGWVSTTQGASACP